MLEKSKSRQIRRKYFIMDNTLRRILGDALFGSHSSGYKPSRHRIERTDISPSVAKTLFSSIKRYPELYGQAFASVREDGIEVEISNDIKVGFVGVRIKFYGVYTHSNYLDRSYFHNRMVVSSAYWSVEDGVYFVELRVPRKFYPNTIPTIPNTPIKEMPSPLFLPPNFKGTDDEYKLVNYIPKRIYELVKSMIESPEHMVVVKEENKPVPVEEVVPTVETEPVNDAPEQGDVLGLEHAIAIAGQQWATIQHGLIERFDRELRVVSEKVDRLKAEYEAAILEKNRIINARKKINSIEVTF